MGDFHPNGQAGRAGPSGQAGTHTHGGGYPHTHPHSAGSSPARHLPPHGGMGSSPGSHDRGLGDARAREREKLLNGAASNPMGFPVSFPPVYAAGHAGLPPAAAAALQTFGQPSSPGGGAVVAGGARGVSVAQERRTAVGHAKGDADGCVRCVVLSPLPTPAYPAHTRRASYTLG